MEGFALSLPCRKRGVAYGASTHANTYDGVCTLRGNLSNACMLFNGIAPKLEHIAKDSDAPSALLEHSKRAQYLFCRCRRSIVRVVHKHASLLALENTGATCGRLIFLKARKRFLKRQTKRKRRGKSC